MQSNNKTIDVSVIPATLNLQSFHVANESVMKRRVAAYARVSTDDEEQLTSYKAQISHYTEYIQSRPEWEFVGMYADEGITGTSTKHRKEFNRMVSDALNGKIDMILIKSISRFARNTVDSLVTIRKLKEKGVEIYFEKENLSTLDSNGEFIITLLSSVAQEESRAISENVTWGKRKSFQDGNVSLAYKHFLGYEKGANGRPQIVEEEAVIVRLIYKQFLQGMAPLRIAKFLSDNGIPTAGGGTKWRAKVITSILSNEKYKGDAILQKTYTVDFMNKKIKKNEGEVPQYYVKNSHEAIITPEVFDVVQYELQTRQDDGKHNFSNHHFASKIRCGICGETYGHRILHAGTKKEHRVWKCKSRYTRDAECASQNVTSEMVEYAFIKAFNQLIDNKDDIIEMLQAFAETEFDLRPIEDELTLVDGEFNMIVDVLRAFIDENAQTAMDQTEYQRKFEVYAKKFEELKNKKAALVEKLAMQRAQKAKIMLFTTSLGEQTDILTEFNCDMWYSLADYVRVIDSNNIEVHFKGGNTVVAQLNAA